MKLGGPAWPLAAMAAIGPILAVPLPQSLVPLFLGTALWGLIHAVIAGRRFINGQILSAIAAMTVLAAASALWSAEPLGAITAALRVGIIAFAGACLLQLVSQLDERDLRRLVLALACGLTLASVLLFLEYVGPELVTRMVGKETSWEGKSVANRSTALLVLVFWPACVALERLGYRYLAGCVLVAVVGGILVSDNRTVKLALALGILVFALSMWKGSAVTTWGRRLIPLLIMVAPILTGLIPDPATTYRDWGWHQKSLHHRLTIWKFVGEKVSEHPVLGWGMDASRRIPGGDAIEMFDVPDRPWEGRAEQMLPLHPHNAILQVWLELGVVGALLLSAVVAFLIGRAGRMCDRTTSSTALAVFASTSVIAASSYGLWQSWWQVTLWLTAVLVICCGRPARPR